MNDLLAIALSNAAWSIPLALIALFVTRRCRQPAVVHAMWLIVLLKLVSPPLVRLPLPELVASNSGQTPITPQAIAASDETRNRTDNLDRQPVPDCGRRILSPTELPNDADSARDLVEAPFVDVSSVTAVPLLSDKQQPKLDVERPIEFESQTPDQSAKEFASHNPWTLDEPRNDQAAAIPQATDAMAPPPAPPPASQSPSVIQIPSESAIAAESPPSQFPVATSIAAQPVIESVTEPLVSPATRQSITTASIAIWAAGSCGWFALALARIVRFAGTVHRASPADDQLAARVAELSARIGLPRGPQVRIVSSRVSPLVWPAMQPVLILPAHLVATLEDAELDAVIGHELAHLRRRDHWTRWLELAVVGVYWWLPVVWLAKRRLHAAEEACCDAWVLWLLPKHARHYARALLTTIDFLTPPRPAPLLASGFGGATSLHGRFEMILHHKPSRSMTTPVKFGVAAFGLLALPLSVIAQTAPSGAPSADAAPKAGNVAPNDPTAPAGAASPTPPSASNDAPPSALPLATPPTKPDPSAENRALPPTGAPSTTPPAAGNAPSAAPLALPPATPPRADANDPFGPPVDPPLSNGAPTPKRARAIRPVPATPAELAPPALDPDGRPGRVSVPANPARPPHQQGDDVNARLDRLEAMIVGLAGEIHAMRRGEAGGSDGPGYGNRIESRPALANAPRVAPSPVNTVSEVGVRTKDKNILLRLGERIEAVDHESGKVVWTTALPGGDQVRSWQVANNMLQVEGADGISVMVDLNNGSIVGKSTPAARIAPSPVASAAAKTAPAVDPERAAKTAAEINELEQAQLQLQNELDRMQIEQEHQLSKNERMRERAKRELDKLDKTPEDKLTGDERKKAEAEAIAQLDKIEDEGLNLSYEFQNKRSTIQQRIRECQIRQLKLTRESNDPASSAPRR